MLAKAWVATAPTPARAHGTTVPTARNLEATAMPHSGLGLASRSAATIENVTSDPAYAWAALWRMSPGSTGYQQAAWWFVEISPSGGISVRQFSGTSSSLPDTIRAFGQRGWNGQPEGGSTGDGTSP